MTELGASPPPPPPPSPWGGSPAPSRPDSEPGGTWRTPTATPPAAPPTVGHHPEPYPSGPPPYGAPPAPPEGSSAPPVIRWGMGDVFYGLLLWLAGGALSAVVIIAAGGVDLDTGEIGELSLTVVAATLAAGWLGFVGWPVVATYLKGQRSLARDFGLQIRWVDVAWGLLGGFGALVVSVMAGVAWTVVSGDEAPSNGDFLPSSPGLVGAVFLWFLVGVCTPVAEELFFRGLVLRAVGRRWGIPVAVVGSSVLFGIFHATAFNLSGLFIVAVTGAYGLVFALLVVRCEGRIGSAIVAHAVVNTVGVVAMLAT